jgi:hypothetical protein
MPVGPVIVAVIPVVIAIMPVVGPVIATFKTKASEQSPTGIGGCWIAV